MRQLKTSRTFIGTTRCSCQLVRSRNEAFGPTTPVVSRRSGAVA